jgi:hypothetical protein
MREAAKQPDQTATMPEPIAATMVKVWSELPSIQKDGYNPHLKSKYANIDSVIKTIRPILTKHGLWLSQPVTASPEGAMVTTKIYNAAGDSMDLGTVCVPVNSKKQDDPQAYGSALTYARRYGLCAALGLATGDDDDGSAANGAGGNDNGKAEPDPDPMTLKVKIQAQIKKMGFTDRDEVLDIVRRVAAYLRAGTTDLDGLVRINSFLSTKNEKTLLEFLRADPPPMGSKG